jgi:hypothetical protein
LGVPGSCFAGHIFIATRYLEIRLWSECIVSRGTLAASNAYLFTLKHFQILKTTPFQIQFSDIGPKLALVGGNVVMQVVPMRGTFSLRQDFLKSDFGPNVLSALRSFNLAVSVL